MNISFHTDTFYMLPSISEVDDILPAQTPPLLLCRVLEKSSYVVTVFLEYDLF